MSRFEARPEDVLSVDGVVAALYESISFAPGAEPDWGRMASLFLEGGLMLPAPASEGEAIEALSPEAFAEHTRRRLAAGAAPAGFRERELGRRVEAFGCVVHVMSGYESRLGEGEGAPAVRGVNSITLVRFAGRFFVACIAWDREVEGRPLPPALGG